MDVLFDYFGEVNEDAIKEHFVTVYELLDEMLDSGFPLTTEISTLKELLPPPSVYNKVLESVTGESKAKADLSSTSLSLIPWRPSNIKYTTNTIYVDIVEELDVIVDRNGSLVHSLIRGQFKVNCGLSGMPDLTMTIRGRQKIDDICLHPCIRYARYEREGLFSFVPPDGMFTLLEYICRDPLPSYSIPVLVRPRFTRDTDGGCSWRVHVSISGCAAGDLESLEIRIPLPQAVDHASCNPSQGSFQFHPTKSSATWDVGTLKRGAPVSLSGIVSSSGGSRLPRKTPSVVVRFKIPLYSVTGIIADSLVIHNESYQPVKAMRNITKSGQCEFRSC